MKNKYQMSKEDNIYKSANLEGIAATCADIVSFMNNVNTGNNAFFY